MHRTLPLLLSALALTACGPASGEEAGRFVRLDPQPGAGALGSLPEPALQRLVVPAQVVPWKVTGPSFEVRPGPQGARVLWIEGGAQVRIEGPFDPGRFQSVVLVAGLKGDHHLNVQVEGGGPALVGSYSGEDADEPQALRFDFPDLRRRREPVAEIRIAVRGPAFALHAVDLVGVPLERSLPTPDAPGLIDVAGDARRGTGLLAAVPLEALVRVERGDLLRFSYARPAELATGPGASWLRVVLQDGERSQERRYELTPSADGSVPWREEREPLEAWSGRTLRVRFELQAADDGPRLAALAEVFVERPRTRPTTVLLITSDTHRGDHLGLLDRAEGLATPTLDALAARGVLFEDCFATSSYTSPSHVAIMTGLSPRDTGVVKNSGTTIKEAAFTLAEAFGQAGFATYAVVTFQHLGPHGTGLGQGFDRMAWCATNDWVAEHPVSQLLDWLPDAQGRPLFAWLHVADAHFPYKPPGEFDRRYYPRARDPFDTELPAPALPPHTLPRELEGLRDLEFPRAQYRGEISYLDGELGRLLEAQRLRGALIAFTSDHGEVLADHGSWFAHLEIWPDTLHVPLILAGPGVPVGERRRGPVLQTDLARTLLDLAGQPDVAFPGQDLLASAPASAQAPRFALGPYGASASITWDGWFLLMALRDSPPSPALALEKHAVLLFDLGADPGCTRDVAASQPEVTARLRAALVRWLSRPEGEPLSEQGIQDAETLARLAALGYTGESWSVEGRAWIDPQCDCSRCRAFR